MYFYRIAALVFAFVALVQAQGTGTITRFSGYSQIVRQSFIISEPMVVQVKDASGRPLANVPVVWAIVQGPGTVGFGGTTFTDLNGKASNLFIAPSLVPNQSFVQTTIQASAPNTAGPVTITMTTYAVDFFGTTSLQATLVYPTLSDLPLTGQTGLRGAKPIQASARAIGGLAAGGIPSVGLKLKPANTDPTLGPTLTCAEAPIVDTDASGNASCTPIFGGKPGTSQFTVNVGNYVEFGPFNYVVSQGPPGMIRLLQGNNQTGNAGSALTVPLAAEVDDAAGNPIQGVNVVFESVTSGGATFTNSVLTSDSSGRVSTNVILGNVSGPVQIRVRTAGGVTTSTGQPIVSLFTVNSNLPLGGLSQIGAGNNQSAVQNTAFAQPLTVQASDPSGNPVAGVVVSFVVTSGVATLSSSTATTNAQGQASVNVTAGPTVGPVVITASGGGFKQAFNLTVVTPGPMNLSFSNSAGFQANWLSPGSIVTISGNGIAPGIVGSVSAPNFFGPLPLQLANVTVQFGGAYAPIYNVSNVNGRESVTVQVPFEVTPGVVPVKINVGGGATTVNQQVLPVSPAIFETTMADGRRRAIIIKSNGTLATPDNPALQGETVKMYATGLGQVTPPLVTNSPGIAGTDSMVVAPVIIGVANAGVQVISATYARNLIGVYEVTFTIPSPLPNGVPPGANVPFALALAQGSQAVFGNGSLISVR